MRTVKLIVLTIAISLQAAFAQENSLIGNAQKVKGSSLESPQIQVIPIKDSKTERNYELYIEVPESYAENKNKRYPVLYYTDAMWHLEMLSGASEFMLKEVILVGISWQKDIAEDLKQEYGAHVSRFTDYSFWKKDNPNHPKLKFGQADNHLAFIRNDVMQYVEQHYRTDPDSRSYFGYSLSGAFGAYILLTQPDTFDNYVLGSPLSKGTVPYLTDSIGLKGLDTTRKTPLNANVFIAYGALEKDKDEPTNAYIDLLKKRTDLSVSVQNEVLEGDHESAFPGIAVRSVRWLSSAISDVSISAAKMALNRNSYREQLEIPQLNKAFINSTPEDREDGVAVGELGVNGGQKDLIVKLAQEIADHKHGRFESLLIAHKDTLLFESYYLRGRINQHHGQASATKAYTGFALGRAIKLGYLSMADLDKPLVGFLNDLDPTKFVAGAEKITLNDALTMRSGIRISEEQNEEMNKHPDRLKGQGRIQALLEYSAPITEDSQVFKYGVGPELVMQVIEAVVPGNAEDFIKNELFDKLGITNYNWRIARATGLPRSGSGSSLTSRAMVKMGVLARNKGKWKGEQLIPEAFITKATSRILYTDDDYEVHYGGKDVSKQGYGYFWWSADLRNGAKTYFSTSAQGGYGQFIVLIEELDLMVVFTGDDNNTNYLQIVAERILPAFIEK